MMYNQQNSAQHASINELGYYDATEDKVVYMLFCKALEHNFA